MKLRSYHTDTVEAAVRMAGIELGDEAIFLGSKKARDNGPYEVTFALVEDQPKSDAPAHTHSLAGAETGTYSERGCNVPPTPKATRPNKGGAAGQAYNAGPEQRKGSSVTQPDQSPAHWRRFVPAPEDLEADAGAVDPVLPDSSPMPIEQQATTRPRRRPSTQERLQREEQLAESIADLSRSLRDVRSWLLRQQGPNGTLLLSDKLPANQLLANRPHEGPSRAEPDLPADPLRAAIYARLIEQGVEAPLIAQILSDARSNGNPGLGLDSGEGRAENPAARAAHALLTERLAFLCDHAGLPAKSGVGAEIVALVGPAGSGKTSALAKLAIRYGLSRGIKVHIVGADPLRVGIAEPIEAYARLLGAPLTQVTDCTDLRGALGRIVEKRDSASPLLILVDTPGYSTADWPSAQRLAAALLEAPEIDTHLVLNIATKPLDLRRMVERYQVFRPSKLLCTKLDETETYGSAVNEAARNKLPLSFFANGPTVPEDLAEVTPSLLARHLLGRGHSAAR